MIYMGKPEYYNVYWLPGEKPFVLNGTENYKQQNLRGRNWMLLAHMP